jgi:hypothetical protein
VKWELDAPGLDEISKELAHCVEDIQAGRFETRTGNCARCGHAFVCPDRGKDAGESPVVDVEV